MRQKFQFLKYIHPFLIGLYPVLSVFGTIPGFTFADMFRSLVLIIAITGIVLFLGFFVIMWHILIFGNRYHWPVTESRSFIL